MSRSTLWLALLILLTACGGSDVTVTAKQAVMTPTPLSISGNGATSPNTVMLLPTSSPAMSCREQVRGLTIGTEVKNEVGGLWLNPSKDQDVTEPFLVRVQAYPEGSNAQPVHHVKFTMSFPSWNVVKEVCANEVASTNVYSFMLDLGSLGVTPNVPFQFSFDVYSVTGNYRKAPNGLRTLVYKPH